jgi:hypothetical protein
VPWNSHSRMQNARMGCMSLRSTCCRCLSWTYEDGLRILVCLLLFGRIGLATTKQHVVALGKWTTVKLPLPEFDPYSSAVGWFRDYAAYCGISDDGKKGWAIIVQLGKRKPLLKKALGAGADMQETECGASIWQRAPSRVIFEPKGEQEFTFTVPTRAVELGTEEENAGEE